MHIPLDEIKRKLEMRTNREIRTVEVEMQIDAVTLQMKQLQNEISVLMPLIKNLDEKNKNGFSKKLSLEGSALLQSLVSLTS